MKRVIVVDASKLWQLFNFYCSKERRESPIERVVEWARRRGYEMWTTEVNLKRAREAFAKKVKNIEHKEELSEIAEWRIRLLLKVVGEAFYSKNLKTAIEILQDLEKEPEDAHALVLAITLSKQGWEVILWQNDEDFWSRAEEIESYGIELRSKLMVL